jgi:hypothetical protein
VYFFHNLQFDTLHGVRGFDLKGEFTEEVGPLDGNLHVTGLEYVRAAVQFTLGGRHTRADGSDRIWCSGYGAQVRIGLSSLLELQGEPERK